MTDSTGTMLRTIWLTTNVERMDRTFDCSSPLTYRIQMLEDGAVEHTDVNGFGCVKFIVNSREATIPHHASRGNEYIKSG